MPGILGKKVGMTRIIQDDGRVIPVTVLECEANEITQVKTVDKDGYPAVVLGFSALKKPTKNRKFYHLSEFKVAEEEGSNLKKGDKISVENFEAGEKVKVTARSKGKGFQGVIKRHNFSRGPETHGSHHHRRPGSIGACTKPGRVAKGKKLPGRMGNARVTLRTEIILLEATKNLICIKGSVPGPNGSLITVKKMA